MARLQPVCSGLPAGYVSVAGKIRPGLSGIFLFIIGSIGKIFGCEPIDKDNDRDNKDSIEQGGLYALYKEKKEYRQCKCDDRRAHGITIGSGKK